MTAADEEPQMPRRLTGGQRVAVAAASLCGLALAAYGVTGSYETISDLAWREGVPLPEFVPAGIDGGLIGVILLDLTLTWTGQPITWLRQLVRLLAGGTIAANAAAGWPDQLSVGLHTAAPLMLLAMVEAARTVLRRRIDGVQGRLRDPIPLARWLLAPVATWLLWRRMVLWQLTSYRAALDTEQRIRHATAVLRARYGPRWKREAPAELVWMLRSGVHAEQACARILTPAATPVLVGITESADAVAVGNGQPAMPTSETITDVGGLPAWPDEAAGGWAAPRPKVRPRRIRIDPDVLVEARRIDAEHLAIHDRHASAATLREALRIGGPEANHLVKIVRGRAPDPTLLDAQTPDDSAPFPVARTPYPHRMRAVPR